MNSRWHDRLPFRVGGSINSSEVCMRRSSQAASSMDSSVAPQVLKAATNSPFLHLRKTNRSESNSRQYPGGKRGSIRLCYTLKFRYDAS